MTADLPEGWRQSTLSDVVDLQRGFDLPAHSRVPGPYPVLTSGEGRGWHNKGPIEGPGFVVGRATNLGKPKWSTGPFWPHNTTLFAKSFRGNDPRWLFHLFEATDLSGFDSGSVQPMLNRNYIAQVRVVVPPLAEQRAIAEVLGALDDKIAANMALAATARELGVAMLRVEAPTTELGNVVLNHKRQISPDRIDDAVVEHYSLPAFDRGGGPDVVTPESIKSNKFAIDTSAVLVSKLNPQTPRIWPIDAGDAPPRLASTEFLVLEPSATDPWVIWALLSQPSFTAALQRKVAGTSGSHQRVRPEEVLATPILDPRAIQPQLLADVGEILAPISSLLRENRTLAATRDALLPQLMSGKMRVRDVEAAACEAGE